VHNDAEVFTCLYFFCQTALINVVGITKVSTPLQGMGNEIEVGI
jgi:hypothetical protein